LSSEHRLGRLAQARWEADRHAAVLADALARRAGNESTYSVVARNAACTVRTKDGCSVPSFGVWPWGAAGGTENHSVV